jgi:hypothetical protein
MQIIFNMPGMPLVQRPSASDHEGCLGVKVSKTLHQCLLALYVICKLLSVPFSSAWTNSVYIFVCLFVVCVCCDTVRESEREDRKEREGERVCVCVCVCVRVFVWLCLWLCLCLCLCLCDLMLRFVHVPSP